MRAQERQAQELRAQKHKTPRDQETKRPRTHAKSANALRAQKRCALWLNIRPASPRAADRSCAHFVPPGTGRLRHRCSPKKR